MEDFITALLRLSLLGSLTAILLLFLRPVLHKFAGWSVVYYLWLVVLLRLCIPAGITVTLPSHADHGALDSPKAISAKNEENRMPEDTQEKSP